MVLLRTAFQDHLPEPHEAADIVLLDTRNGYALEKIEETRAWNPQQGTMLYWNPEAPANQFFFNDRDPDTNQIFCVLYDIEKRKRVREYRFDDGISIGNGGVAQRGGFFLGINYGRLARLRPVTGYPGASDWTADIPCPENDGVFKVDVASGRRTLLVSFAQLARAIPGLHPETALFVNHTLCSRENEWIYFFARGDWRSAIAGDRVRNRINTPFSIRVDGTGLARHERHIGGHPEWAPKGRLIGRDGRRQILYDVNSQVISGHIGTPEVLPNPEGDVALSPDGLWLVNGHKNRQEQKNHYNLVHLETGEHYVLPSMDIGGWTSGDLRLDAAPCWRPDGRAIAVPGLAADGTRQTFVIELTY